MSEEKTMTVIAMATVTPFYANMHGFDIFTVAVFLFLPFRVQLHALRGEWPSLAQTRGYR